MSGINNLWLVVGIIVLALGLRDLFYFGLQVGVLLNIAIGSLVVYTSIHNMGGWDVVKYKIKRFFK